MFSVTSKYDKVIYLAVFFWSVFLKKVLENILQKIYVKHSFTGGENVNLTPFLIVICGSFWNSVGHNVVESDQKW